MGSGYGSLNRQINNKVGVIKKNAPYQPLTPIQDEEEEEIVSLASEFDDEVDPFEVEQETTPAPYSGLNAVVKDAVATANLEALDDPTLTYGKKQRVYPDSNQEYSINWDMLDSVQGIFPEGTDLFGSNFLGGGGGFGGTGSGGGTTGSIELTEEQVQVGTENLIRNQITAIGLDPATFTSEQLTDVTAFRAAFEPQKTKFLQDQRDSLYELHESGDTAEFSKIYDQLDTNSQINFLHSLYKNNSIDKKTYLNLAGSSLATEEARQQTSLGREEPIYGYFVESDYDTGDRLYRYPTSMGPESAKEVVLLEDQKYRGSVRPDDYDGIVSQEETFLRELGTTNSEGVDKRSSWVSMRDEGLIPMVNIGLSIATAGMSDVVQVAVKAAQGKTLKGEDYATVALAGLSQADIISAPVGAEEAAKAGTDAMNAANAAGLSNAVALGTAAQEAAVAGKGILGLSYNATSTLINAAATGDPKKAIASTFSTVILEKSLEALPTGQTLDDLAASTGIQADDLKAGLSKSVELLVDGVNLDKAIIGGVGKYVAEGGTILPDAIEDAIGDAAKKVGDLVEPITTALSTINDSLIKPVTKEVGGLLSGADTTARQALSALDDNVIQPLTENVGDALSQADTAVRQGLATFDEEVLQPVTQPLGDALEDAAQATGDVIEDVGQATGDVVEDVGQAVGDVVEDVGQAVGDVAEDVGQVTGDVVEDVAQVTGDVLSNADTTARNVLSEVDDAFINPAGDIIEDVAQATGDVIEDVGQVVGDVAEDVSQEVGDALSAAETAVRQALEDIDLPEIDIDLPEIDIDLPEIDIDLNVPQVTSAPSATRTTGGLFDVAQFEHDKGISLIGNLLTGLTEQDANKLSRKQYQQPKEEEVVDLLSDPFANAFNYKV